MKYATSIIAILLAVSFARAELVESTPPRFGGAIPLMKQEPSESEKQSIIDIIMAHRPSTLTTLPADFNARFGATHSDGKYHFTDKPFLVEGAEKMLELGTGLGKFWFSPDAVIKFYPFNSNWVKHNNLLELARDPYFEQVWDMPFKTFVLTANCKVDEGWRKPDLPQSYYDAIIKEYYDLSRFFYQRFKDREVTVILQNWEGDWLLRGIGNEWKTLPPDWEQRCIQMQKWFAARQAGVNKARAEFAGRSKCVVAHCIEVNRVADAWKGIPTVTRNVLPGVEVDLISHSAYDGINGGDPYRFWQCLNEIRQYAKTGPLFGPGALMVGEYGIPENDRPDRIYERYDEMMGVMLAMNVRFAAHWEIFCNEFAGKPENHPRPPVTDPSVMRGFWMIKPDGTLGGAGIYYKEMWDRANMQQRNGRTGMVQVTP